MPADGSAARERAIRACMNEQRPVSVYDVAWLLDTIADLTRERDALKDEVEWLKMERRPIRWEADIW